MRAALPGSIVVVVLSSLAALAASGCPGPEPTVECTSNADCEPGKFCQHPVGQCTNAGTCEPIPSSCVAQTRTTCGCDGRTYGGGCSAAMAGVSVEHYPDQTGMPCP